MVKVDFYFLQQQNASHIYPFAWRLLNKIIKQNQTVFVSHENEAECNQFNQFLWQYQDIDFLPHCLIKEEISTQTPIVLGLNNEIDVNRILLNFCHTPPTHSLPKRIIEIVPDEPNWRTIARQKYRLYQHQSAEIRTHKL